MSHIHALSLCICQVPQSDTKFEVFCGDAFVFPTQGVPRNSDPHKQKARFLRTIESLEAGLLLTESREGLTYSNYMVPEVGIEPT